MKTPVTPPGGINTGANPFTGSTNPMTGGAVGAMRQADNCVIPSRDRMESRRGGNLSTYATSSAPTTTGEFYSDTLFTQHGTKLSRDTGSAFTEVGTYSPPSGASMKFLGGQGREVNGDFYFTTSAGVQTMDSTTATPKLSGVAKPLFYLLSLNGNVDAGWMPKDAAVGYRLVLGRKDAHNNIKLSAPSGRAILVNPANLTVAIGALVLNGANVATATVASHSFKAGDKLSLAVTGGDVGKFTLANNIVTSVTANTIVWGDALGAWTNVASVTITSGSKNAEVRAAWQTGEAVAGDFVQVYRTLDVAGASIDPGDECYLAYERVLTATDISNGYVIITDTTPSSFIGGGDFGTLYTNANSGDGEQATNDRPPLAKDICLFDGRAFFLNTTGRHQLEFKLLGTGAGVSGLQSGDVVAINTRAFIAGTDFTCETRYSASINIEYTVQSLALGILNAALTNTVGYLAYATHDGDNGTGGVLLEEVALASTFAVSSSGAINAIYGGTSRTGAFADSLATTKAVTAASTARTLFTTVNVRCTAHGFAQGDVVMLCYANSGTPDSNFAPGLKTVATVTDANNFVYLETGSNATLSGATAAYFYATTFKSVADTLPVMFSKSGQPDAVPLLNFIQDIPKGQTVLRAAPLRQSLYVFLANGDIWTISGTYPYRVSKFDGTATLIAEGSLVEHNNRLHCLTTQGVVAIGEGGVEVLDEAIKPDLLPLIAAETSAGTLGSIRACSYESDHQYRLYLSTTSSFYVYIYNSLYRKWTRQTDGRAWGVVRRSTNRLYEGHTSIGRFWLERKAYTRNDFADLVAVVNSGATSSGSDTLTGVNGAMISQIAVGDVLSSGDGGGTAAWLVSAVSAGGATVTAAIDTRYDTNAESLATFVGEFGASTLYVFRSISCPLVWLHDSNGSPHNEKQWRDFVLHFSRYSVSSATASFSAIDGSSAGTGTITAAAPQAYSFATTPTLPISHRVNIDEALQTTPQLAVGLTVAECFAVWTLLGHTLEVEEGSERMVT